MAMTYIKNLVNDTLVTHPDQGLSTIGCVWRFALIGVSHRRGGAAALENWQSELDEAALKARGFVHFVCIATCNRWDMVTILPPELSIEQARYKLSLPGHTLRPYAFVGDAALEQLIRIASSLDSLNPGEDQIMKQVRDAYAKAKSQGTVEKALAFAFETALKIAKKVRRESELAPMHTSLFSLARPEIESCLKPGDKVAVLGTGAMGNLAAKSLAFLGYDVLLVNRSEASAKQLAQQLKQRYQSLERFLELTPELELSLLVCATPVKHLVDAQVLATFSKLKLIVDLGLPRNVDAGAAKARGIRVLDVDSLQSAGQLRREELAQRLARAETIIQFELDVALQEWSEKQIGPGIKRLKDWYLASIGDTLGAEEAEKLAHKFAHVPVKGLRALARTYGPEAAKIFLQESGLDVDDSCLD